VLDLTRKVFHLLERRRQTDQIEVQPAKERARIGGRRGFEPLVLELGEDETVDRRERPAMPLDRGDDGRLQRLIRPVLSGRLKVDAGGLGGDFGARIGSAELHPPLEVANDRVGQLALGRHAQFRAGVAHRLDEQAFAGPAGNDGGAAVAAGAQCVAAVEQEAAALLLGRLRMA
jgi:hypothetical protein